MFSARRDTRFETTGIFSSSWITPRPASLGWSWYIFVAPLHHQATVTGWRWRWSLVTTGVDIILLLSSWHKAVHWLGAGTGDLDACCQHGATSARVTGGLELVSGPVCLSTVSLNLMWDNSIPASFAHYYSQCSEYPLWCKSVGQTGGERGELVYPALPSTTQHYLDRPTTNGRSAGHSPGRLAQLCVTTRGGEGEGRGGTEI